MSEKKPPLTLVKNGPIEEELSQQEKDFKHVFPNVYAFIKGVQSGSITVDTMRPEIGKIPSQELEGYAKVVLEEAALPVFSLREEH